MEDRVQHQFGAFNNRKIDAFMVAYVPEIIVKNGKMWQRKILEYE